jgi:RNA polymerase sigma-70 factor (ECF subfamily)
LDLDEIFRAHQKEVFVYFLRTVGERVSAEDLAQETFIRACTSAVLFRGESSVRTWIFSIARRVLADHYRRKAPENLVEPPEVVVESDPDSRLDIERALNRLPMPWREAVVLCDALGLSPTDAAGITGVTANAFRVRLHRARQGFREVFGGDR